MRTLIHVVATLCLTASLNDAAPASAVHIVSYESQMVEDDVVDMSGALTTRFEPCAIKMEDSSGRQVLAIYLQGQRKQVYVRYGTRTSFTHRDSRYIAPGNPFRALLRRSFNGVIFYLLDEKSKISFQREIPVAGVKVWLEGAYVSGRIEKSVWRNYLCLPTNCGNRENPADIPTGMCKSVVDEATQRIVGGSPARAGDYPWQVSLWKDEFQGSPPVRKWNHACGGTLISECWVLSAAHCYPQAWDTERWLVRVGDYYKDDDRDKEFSTYENSRNFTIKKIFTHSNYWSNGLATVNDVALIHLEADANGRCATYGRFAQPACLPTSANQFDAGTECVITGWGATKHGQVLSEHAKCLQKAQVNLITNTQCKDDYPDTPGANLGDPAIESIHDSMQCTEKSGAKEADTCQGDSGGPLVCSSNGRSYVWGITSWGKGCGKNYGIYTRVFSFMDFIEKRLVQECKFVP